MARTSQPGPGLVPCGERPVRERGGSLLVNFPARVAMQQNLAAGDDLVVGTGDDSAIVHPPGVPLADSLQRFGGSSRLQRRNGEYELTIPDDVAADLGLTADSTVTILLETGRTLVHIRTEGPHG